MQGTRNLFDKLLEQRCNEQEIFHFQHRIVCKGGVSTFIGLKKIDRWKCMVREIDYFLFFSIIHLESTLPLSPPVSRE